MKKTEKALLLLLAVGISLGLLGAVFPPVLTVGILLSAVAFTGLAFC